MAAAADIVPHTIFLTIPFRAGAGGDEAALFAAEIYRMYVHYAEEKRWKVELAELEERIDILTKMMNIIYHLMELLIGK